MNRFTENYIMWWGEWDRLKEEYKSLEKTWQQLEKAIITQLRNVNSLPERIKQKYGFTEEIKNIFDKAESFKDLNSDCFKFMLLFCNSCVYDSGDRKTKTGINYFIEHIDNVQYFSCLIIMDLLVTSYQIHKTWDFKELHNIVVIVETKEQYKIFTELFPIADYGQLFEIFYNISVKEEEQNCINDIVD